MKSTQAEQWRPIPGYEGHYEVSDHGRVRSVTRILPHPVNGWKTYRGKLLKQDVHKTGHIAVWLSLDGRMRSLLVHRLVLMAFIGPCPDGMEACHWNDDPGDNRLENLRWTSRRDNNLDRVRNGIHPMAKKTHCKRGHEFTPENTRIEVRTTGKVRRCRQCERERSRRRKAALKKKTPIQ